MSNLHWQGRTYNDGDGLGETYSSIDMVCNDALHKLENWVDSGNAIEDTRHVSDQSSFTAL
jgi:hypothetical protein